MEVLFIWHKIIYYKHLSNIKYFSFTLTKDITARYIIVETEPLFNVQWLICHSFSHLALQRCLNLLVCPFFNSNFVVVVPGCFEDLFFKVFLKLGVCAVSMPLTGFHWNTHGNSLICILRSFFTSEVVNNDSEYLFAFPLMDSYSS